MKKIRLFSLVLMVLFTFGAVADAGASTRIKDVAKVQGVRANQLVGYGLVSGLTGTGDSDKTVQTMQSIASMMKTFGVTVSAAKMKSKNMAAVMVTAQLPPYLKAGDTIDVTVSSMGDAKSLQGGILLQTPLRGANGQVYAVAQGPVSIGGFAAGGGGNSQQKNFLTVGTTPNGAIVEKEVPMQMADNGTVRLALNQPDFTTANRIAEVINQRFGGIAMAKDPGTVEMYLPGGYSGNPVAFIAAMEEIYVVTDTAAKVVINERTGTVVLGGNVSIDQVAVAQGGLSVKITKDKDVSQPNPLSGGKTADNSKTNVTVDEAKANLLVLPSTSNVGDVVNALNAVGATPRDIIAILQAMKAAGALHAELQII